MSARQDPPERGAPVHVQGEPTQYYPAIPPEVRRGAVHPVCEVGHELLHRPCRDAAGADRAQLAGLIDDLFATMYVAEGAGLAANQIGVDLRVFVYDCVDEWGVRHVGHLVDPAVVEVTPDRVREDAEGCLSVPGAVAVLARPARAVVGGRDRLGRSVTIEGQGYFARCLLHEVDHLDGRLYLDLLDDHARESALQEMAELRPAVLAQRERRAHALTRSRVQRRP